MVYTILPGKFKRDDVENQDWIPSADLSNEFKQSDEPLEIFLIGLDGRVKLKRSEFLLNNDLFARIDQMPMRRNEIQRRENGK